MLKSRKTTVFITSGLIIICIVCYHNSCSCGFVFDDMSAIRDNKDLRSNTPLTNLFLNDFWGTPIKREQSHKSYRPLTVLTFRINYFIHKMHPYGYHLVNVVLHTIVCLMYKRTLDVFLKGDLSLLATMLFTVHPIHTEAVTGVVGRAEILSSLFFMISLLFYRYMGQSSNGLMYAGPFIVTLICAVLCKEQGITVSGICLVQDFLLIYNLEDFMCKKRSLKTADPDVRKRNEDIKKSVLRIVFLIIVTGCIFVGRLYVMGSELPTFTKFDNPASAESNPAKYLTWSYLVYQNLMLLIFPSSLCCDWTMGTIPIIHSLYDVRNLATLSTLLIFVYFLFVVCKKNRNNTKPLILGLSWLVLPFIPASNLFFPVGFVIAERVLYIPSMGFCVIIAQGILLLCKKFRTKALKILPIYLIIIHGLKTHHRNLDWKNEYTIFISGVKVNRNNAKLLNNVGHALENEGKHYAALDYFQKAIQVQNDDIGAYINLGRVHKNLQNYEEAEKMYKIAKNLLPKSKPGKAYQTKIAPHYLNVFINLANLISSNETRLDEADSLYKEAIGMREDYIQAYINRGDVLMKLNKSASALESYETALRYEYHNADLHYNVGVVLLEQGQNDSALLSFEKALQINSEHPQALLNSAILLQESGRQEKIPIAKMRLLKLMELNENNDRVFFNLGMLAMDENENENAIFYFKRAIQLNPSFKSALFNLSLLLVDTKHPTEALSFLQQLVANYPNNVKGLILLGEIYLNTLKDLDAAEKCYRQVIEIDPVNIQGLHNLCVVYVERNRLKDALLCFENVHKLAPNENYIMMHIKIVESKLSMITKMNNLKEKKSEQPK